MVDTSEGEDKDNDNNNKISWMNECFSEILGYKCSQTIWLFH